MTEFRVVDDALRATKPRRATPPRKPEYDALESGKTVFIPLNGKPRQYASLRSAMAARGYLISAIRTEVDGEEGWLTWVTGKRDR